MTNTTARDAREDELDRQGLRGDSLERIAALRQAVAILVAARGAEGLTVRPSVAPAEIHRLAEYILTGRYDDSRDLDLTTWGRALNGLDIPADHGGVTAEQDQSGE